MAGKARPVVRLHRERGKVIPHPTASIRDVVEALRRKHGWVIDEVFVNGAKVPTTSELVPKAGDQIRMHLAK